MASETPTTATRHFAQGLWAGYLCCLGTIHPTNCFLLQLWHFTVRPAFLLGLGLGRELPKAIRNHNQSWTSNSKILTNHNSFSSFNVTCANFYRLAQFHLKGKMSWAHTGADVAAEAKSPQSSGNKGTINSRGRIYHQHPSMF